MESTTAYITSIVISLIFLLLAALTASVIQYEGGSNPKDHKRRRIWFWIIGVFNPVVCFLLGYFVFKPDANIMVVNEYTAALSMGTAIGFVLYILLGFVCSKVFRNGKLGHWF